MTEERTARVPCLTERERVPDGHRHHYDSIEESRGDVRGPFGVLLNSPPVAGRVGHLGAYVRYESELPGAVRELAIVTTARELDCAYEWAVHEPLARNEGVDETTIEVVATGGSVSELAGIEATVVRFGRELFRDHEVSDAAFDDAADRLGVRGVTELTATMGYYGMLACVLNAIEVTPGDDAPDLP